VNCAERGALLLRVRDEIRMTLTAYQSLYESSVAFGMRKALMADQRKNELRAKVKLLTAEVRELEKAADGLQSRSGDLEASEKQRYAQDEEKHAAEVGKLKTANDDLREQLEGLLAVKR
jgi:dynein light intermediate chain, axonemal